MIWNTNYNHDLQGRSPKPQGNNLGLENNLGKGPFQSGPEGLHLYRAKLYIPRI